MEANETNAVVPRKRRFVPQWSLSTMLLLTAVVAAWVPYVRFRRQIPEIEQQVVSMRAMARELIVEDPTQITVVHLPQTWHDEYRWDIHLPEGDYRMRLATREVDEEGFPPAVEQAFLSGGRHRVELLQSKEEECKKITIMVDDRLLIETVESPGWPPNHGSSDTGNIGNCTQVSPDKPATLFRRRYMHRTPGGMYGPAKGPADGILLWVERIGKEGREATGDH